VALHGRIPSRREHVAFASQPERPLLDAQLLAEKVKVEAVEDLLDGAHMTRLPYSMAYCKPCDAGLRHFLWRNTAKAMNDAPFADIAERIRWHRNLEGLRQSDYAAKAGIKRSQLSNWESGQQRVSIDGALALRHTYGLSLDFIYEGIDDALPMTLRVAWRDRPEVNASK